MQKFMLIYLLLARIIHSSSVKNKRKKLGEGIAPRPLPSGGYPSGLV